MASFNRVILMGNVTRPIELKYLQSGTAVTELGLAVNDRRKSQTGEMIEETVFVDITLWGRTAEIASEYLNKGSPVFIEGRLKYDTWEADGQKRSKLRVVGERMQLIGARGGAGGQGGPRDFDESEYSRPTGDHPPSGPHTSAAGAKRPPAAAAGPPQDDIPF
jgi:single-strand DNA-binding protein